LNEGHISGHPIEAGELYTDKLTQSIVYNQSVNLLLSKTLTSLYVCYTPTYILNRLAFELRTMMEV